MDRFEGSMLEFEITRDLPPPIGVLNDGERVWLTEALAILATGDEGPLERALQQILENRISEQEFDDFLLFEWEDQREILQRVAAQVPELAGIHLNDAGE
jgi:hypothetical protein